MPTVALIGLLTLCCATGFAQEKVTLAYHAKAGQTAHYKHEATLSMDAEGQKMHVDVTETGQVTVTSVSATGDLTTEHSVESRVEDFNGAKNDSLDDDEKAPNTVVTHADGVLVSYKDGSSKGEKDEEHLDVRLYIASHPVFSDKPVGVGDKWSHEVKSDSDLGSHAAKADYELVDFEKAGGVDAAKVKIAFAETEANGIKCDGTITVDKSSGELISEDYTLENFPGPNGSMKVHGERTDGSLNGAATAQTADAKKTDAKPGDKKDTKPEAKKDEKKEKTIDETVKDGYEKLPGLFTLYRKKENGRDTIYMEVKESQLDKALLLEATAATGTAEQIVAGDPINDILFKFAKLDDDRLMMCTPNIYFRADDNKPIARAVRRSFADAYLEAFKIEARQPDRKSMLINVSQLFTGDIAGVSEAFSGGGSLLGFGRGGYSMDRDKTFITSLKNFPENLVVETLYHFTHGGSGGSATLADPRSAPIKVNYTLFALNDDGYRPRIADPRVGYFVTQYQDFNDDAQDDPMVRYVYRWHLEKADPKAKLSAPKKPIVFWLDNAIPVEYRDAVKQGLLYWNKAFEGVGIKDAIQIKQMPDNADWDHADMRYNTIRWVTSPVGGYAVSLMRVNPMTGQIINANITVDAGLVHFTKVERNHVVDPATYFVDPAPVKPGSLRAIKCEMAAGAREQAWFGDLALRMLSGPGFVLDEKAYTNAFIRDVVSHEMGHIMGLRHNFVASTYHSLDDLKDESKIQQDGITASVMDYNPFNISAIKQKGVDYWTPTIGPYDKWAIQYGYSFIDAKTPAGERFTLNQIASQDNLPGHAYESDEVADQFDPDVVRFDLGKDPLAYWTRMLDLSRYLMLHLGDRVPKQGEGYEKFTNDLEMMINQYARAAAISSRFVGGLNINRNHRGDAGEKPTLAPVNATDQRRALNLLNTYVFAENAFTIPRSYYTKLADDPWDMSSMFFGAGDYPVRDQLANIQTAALRRLFSAPVLRRVANNEYKIGDPNKALTLPELYRTVGATIWSELEGHRNINTLRRQLQRTYVDTMAGMALGTINAPDDAKMLAWDQLRQLKHRLQAAQRGGQYDDYTRIHLAETAMKIDRALDAKQTIGGGGGASRPLTLMDLLGGEKAPNGQ